MRKILPLLLAGIFSVAAVQAQKVSGIVKDANGKAIEKSTVALLRAKDSSVIKLGVTGDKGVYTFNVGEGNYRVRATHVGHATAYTSAFEVSGAGDTNLPELVLVKASGELKGVTVTAQRPMIEVKADKTILNVEGTINAVGNDALELLRKSPGVMIDKDDNISLAGKNGVQVYIDGKPSPLSGTDLPNYLKSLQSAQIESIEIITNPSAKYEAAGNAGIINIRLKKNKAFGTNGSVNAGYVQGTYAKYNGGLALNHRNKRINIFGNYNYNNGKNLMKFFMRKEQFDTLFEQRNTMRFLNNTHGFKGGIDYFINNNNTLGVVVNGNIANNDFYTAGPMNFTYQPTGQLVKILDATNHNDMERNNVNTNINYRYADVKKGQELNLDADYGFYKIRSNQYQPNYYYEADGTTEINRVIYNMISPTDIDLYSFKADYEQNFKGGKLGIGGKVGIVNTDNDFQRYDVYNTGKVLDTLKSNRFEYEENINALYVNYNKQLKTGIMIQVGLRAENTHSKGISTGFTRKNGGYESYDSTFDRDYTDLFPSASVTFNKNPMKQWTISYSRRIDRPAYQDLNPFEFKLNEYTYMKGNTLLRPQYTNSIGLTNIYKYKLTTTLNYSHVKDIFAQLPDTIDKTKGFLTKKNLATQDIVSLNISYPFQYKWYNFFATLNANYSHYVADFGGGDRKVDQSVFAFTYFMQNSIKLGKGWTAELSGLFISPSLWQGVFKSEAMGSVDMGFQKALFNGKANVRAVVADVFQTMKWAGSTNFAGVNARANGNGEQPQFKLNVSYRFGSAQIKAARQRKTGIEDENKRANTTGGQGIGQ
ncbi:MAG TPA: TonB-dependent receptor [Chitinophagaceae bacterium]|nr:TonB-dependent receptor [Chitinophagaceae bacterium]